MTAASGCSVPPARGLPASGDWELPFTLRGRLDDPRAVSWRVEAGDGPIGVDELRVAAVAATESWSELTRDGGAPVGFRLAGEGEPAELLISWRAAADDPCQLFGRGTGVAHTGPMSSGLRGTFMHLDADREWGPDAAQPGGLLRRAVAHEFGHVLGLDHSLDAGTLMYPDTHASAPTAGDLAGVCSLYGGGQDAPGDVVIESADEGGRCSPPLRGVAPPDRTALALFDVDGSGDDELLVWRTDPTGFGAATVYDFTLHGSEPRVVRTLGPTLDMLPLGTPSFLRRSPDGRRWILQGEGEATLVYGFDEHGGRRVPEPQEWLALDIQALLREPGPDVIASPPRSQPRCALGRVPGPDNMTDGRRVTELVGDLDGDGRLERVRRLSANER